MLHEPPRPLAALRLGVGPVAQLPSQPGDGGVELGRERSRRPPARGRCPGWAHRGRPPGGPRPGPSSRRRPRRSPGAARRTRAPRRRPPPPRPACPRPAAAPGAAALALHPGHQPRQRAVDRGAVLSPEHVRGLQGLLWPSTGRLVTRGDGQDASGRADGDVAGQVGLARPPRRRPPARRASRGGDGGSGFPCPAEIIATRGRSRVSTAGRPGSSEPWWDTFSTSTGRRGRRAERVALGVGGQQHVEGTGRRQGHQAHGVGVAPPGAGRGPGRAPARPSAPRRSARRRAPRAPAPRARGPPRRPGRGRARSRRPGGGSCTRTPTAISRSTSDAPRPRGRGSRASAPGRRDAAPPAGAGRPPPAPAGRAGRSRTMAAAPSGLRSRIASP